MTDSTGLRNETRARRLRRANRWSSKPTSCRDDPVAEEFGSRPLTMGKPRTARDKMIADAAGRWKTFAQAHQA